jgi:hypothetical protein
MARKSDTTEVRPASFDLNDPTLKAIMAEAVATALAAQRAELLQAMAEQQRAAKPATNDKPSKSAENLQATIRAFKRLGIKDIQPHINVLTFRKWTEKGYRPLEKSKAVRVGGLRLWHQSQVRPLSKEEIGAMKAQSEAADKRQKSANVTELHPQ